MSSTSKTSGEPHGEALNIANFPLATIGAAQPACPICGALVAWNGTRSHLRWHDEQEGETLLAEGGSNVTSRKLRDRPSDLMAALERSLGMTPPESELSATDVSSSPPTGDEDRIGAARFVPGAER